MKTGSTNITERVGQTVLYTLDEADARAIVQNRLVAGSAAARGNDPRDGESYPAIIVRDFGYSGTPAAVQERADAHHRHLAAQYRKSQGLTDAEALAEPGWPSEFTDMTERDFQAHLADALLRFGAEARKSALAASVNLQVFLDGVDVYWATSRSVFDPTSHGRWVQRYRVEGEDHEPVREDEMPPNYIPVEADVDRGDMVWREDPRGHWQHLVK